MRSIVVMTLSLVASRPIKSSGRRGTLEQTSCCADHALTPHPATAHDEEHFKIGQPGAPADMNDGAVVEIDLDLLSRPMFRKQRSYIR